MACAISRLANGSPRKATLASAWGGLWVTSLIALRYWRQCEQQFNHEIRAPQSMRDQNGQGPDLGPPVRQAVGPEHTDQVRANRKRHPGGPGEPPKHPKRLLASEEIMLREYPSPPILQVRPSRAGEVLHDRVRFVAEPVAGPPCPKRPVHVLRNSHAKPADGIKDVSPNPHVAAASVTFDQNVAFKIKPKYHFPCLDRSGPARITRGGFHVPAGEIIGGQGTNAVFDPVGSRVTVAVDEGQDFAAGRLDPGVAGRARALDRRVNDMTARSGTDHRVETAGGVVVGNHDLHPVGGPRLTSQAGDAHSQRLDIVVMRYDYRYERGLYPSLHCVVRRQFAVKLSTPDR